GLEKIHVERGDAECAQVLVLLAAQRGDGEAADRVEVVGVLRGTHVVAFDVHRFAGRIGAGDVLDVVAAVAGGGPAAIVRVDAAAARLHRQREIVDLRAGIVVVELALDVPAGRRQQAGEAVADRRRTAVADVQRAGRVRRDELDLYLALPARFVAAVRRRLV